MKTLPGLISPSKTLCNKISRSGLATEAMPPLKPIFFQNSWLELGSICGTPTLPITAPGRAILPASSIALVAPTHSRTASTPAFSLVKAKTSLIASSPREEMIYQIHDQA